MMRLLKDYKGVALIYIILTVVNIIWIVGYEKPIEKTQVGNERNVVINA